MVVSEYRPHVLKEVVILASLIIISLYASFLVISFQHASPENMVEGYKAWIIGTLVITAVGALSIIIYKNIVPPILFALPLFIAFLEEHKNLTPLSLTLYVYTTTCIGILLYFVIKRGGANQLFSFKPRVEGREEGRCAAISIGISLLMLGLLGMLAGNILQSIYGSYRAWITVALLTSLGLAIGCVESRLWLSAISPLSPATLTVFFLPTGDHEIATVPSLEKGIEIGTQLYMLHFSKGKRDNACWIPLKNKTVRIDPWAQRNPHMLILGDSGSGKSYLAKIIAIQKKSLGEPVIIMDMHGEYTGLEENGYLVVNPYVYKVNPLDLDGEPPSARALEFSYTVAELFNLGALQRGLLIDLVREIYMIRNIYDEDPSSWNNTAPKLRDLIHLISERIELVDRRDEKARLEALRRYLSLLDLPGEKELAMDALLNGNIVLELNRAPNPVLQQLLTVVLLRKIFLSKQKRRGHLTIILDEFHRLAATGSLKDEIENLIAEARKFGISFIMITQSPLSLSPKIISNTATRLTFRLSETVSLEKTARNIAPTYDKEVLNTIKYKLKTLPPRQAILSSDEINTLIILQTPTLH